MYQRIVVPLDGSPFGEQALPAALTLARRTGASIELVHAQAPPLMDPVAWMPYSASVVEEMERATRARDERYLVDLATRLAADGGPAVRWALLAGQAVPAIEDRVRRSDADLVVMTTHGRGGLARAWLGSVADGLLRRLQTPILLVRPGEAAGEAEPAAEVALQRILVPLDGSALAEAALEPAVALARAVDGHLTLLGVVVPLLPPGTLAAPSLLDLEPEVVHTRTYLASVAKRLQEASVETRVDVVVHAFPASAILDFVAEHGIDVVALATHGRGGLRRVMLGSVADKVVRGASVPVLVRRPGEAWARAHAPEAAGEETPSEEADEVDPLG